MSVLTPFQALWRYVVWGIAGVFLIVFFGVALHLYESEEVGGGFEMETVHQEPLVVSAVSIDIPHVSKHQKGLACHPRHSLGMYGRAAGLKGPGPFVSVVVFGLGHDQKLTKDMLARLPRHMAVALPVEASQLSMLGQSFYKSGHEVLLEVPLESDAPVQRPHILPASISGKDLSSYLEKALAHLPRAIGMTYKGGNAFIQNAQSMTCFLDFCCQRHLLFLDTGGSLFGCKMHAQNKGLWTPACNIFKDGGVDIEEALLTDALRRNRSVILGVTVTRGDVQALINLPARLSSMGAKVVPLSAQFRISEP